MSFADEIKKSFKSGSVLIKLIYINIGVFIVVNLIYLVLFLMNIQAEESIQQSFLKWFAVPADTNELLRKPWTFITYMFLHENFMHILFNMLWLWWFGRIFLQYLDQKKLLGVYFLGGLGGAFLYVLAFNVFPVFEEISKISIALGASASVIAIVVAISAYVPNYTINLIFLGPVKLKWIALVMIGIDIISIASYNAGGHIAHLGGALIGWLYAGQFRKGKDISKGMNNFLLSIFIWKKKPKRKKMRVTYKKPKSDMAYMADKAKSQEEINRILDKIAKSGYDSLSKAEKETLFKESKK